VTPWCNLELEQRMRLVRRADELADADERRIAQRADAGLADDLALHRARVVLQRLRRGEHVLGAGQQAFARGVSTMPLGVRSNSVNSSSSSSAFSCATAQAG
jgi:hypothetical protein